jgi:hypothetical protein
VPSDGESKPLTADEPAVDQLSFIDLLYAVPIGDLAMRVSGAQLDRISAADWSAVAVVLAVIVLSWVGVHKDRAALTAAERQHKKSRVGFIRFGGLSFVQFLIEVLIIGLYFAMGLTLHLPAARRGPVPLPSQTWLTAFLLFIFLAYMAWDGIDFWRGSRYHDDIWQKRAKDRGRVTLWFLYPCAGFYLVARLLLPRTTLSVVLRPATLPAPAFNPDERSGLAREAAGRTNLASGTRTVRERLESLISPERPMCGHWPPTMCSLRFSPHPGPGRG